MSLVVYSNTVVYPLEFLNTVDRGVDDKPQCKKTSKKDKKNKQGNDDTWTCSFYGLGLVRQRFNSRLTWQCDSPQFLFVHIHYSSGLVQVNLSALSSPCETVFQMRQHPANCFGDAR
ncbi:hypothetical protein K435DRAFT_880049 [Dendrothele bispora CBS 962.96]|uniref:Uncharacterized protein n=1 Tax=Dendrothele bispora (strain CBS 962.96) TaxID=1314807 RepID=A0A4S8KK26_DENBC|nr:hypothetical protein K435DRAFT_880049 [Dendrothele bispora CBS 962.96]